MVTSVSHSSQKATVVSPNAASVSHGNLKATMVSQNAAPLFVKIFTERRALAKAAQQAGVRVISIDHEVVQPFAPMVVLDHTTEGGTHILWDVLQSPGLAAVHMGLSGGVSSRARELPIPKA